MGKHYGKGMLPGPVYEATLKDGSTARMTFYSESGKPVDFGRGRRLVAACYGRPRDELGYITSKGKRRVDEIVHTLYRHVCRARVFSDAERKYVECGHSWEDHEFAPESCPSCHGGGYNIYGSSVCDINGNISHLLTYPPAEVIDGWVELPSGERVRDPYFSGETLPVPAKRGKTGAALVQHVLKQLEKDDSAEARAAVAALRRLKIKVAEAA